jgi:hypothetical protein
MQFTLDHWRRARAADPGRSPTDLVEAVMRAFEMYVRNADSGMTLDRAFEAVGPSGGDPWYVTLSRERRNGHMRAMADAACPDGTLEAKTDAYRREMRRRQSSASPFRAFVDAIHREGKLCGIPDNPDTIRKILSAQPSEITKEPVAFKKPAQMPG